MAKLSRNKSERNVLWMFSVNLLGEAHVEEWGNGDCPEDNIQLARMLMVGMKRYRRSGMSPDEYIAKISAGGGEGVTEHGKKLFAAFFSWGEYW